MAYHYYPAGAVLHKELLVQGIPVVSSSGPDENGKFSATYAPDATPEEIAKGDDICATWPNTDYEARPLWDIKTQLQQLPYDQLQSIFDDLWQGQPPKLLQAESIHMPGMFALYCVWQFTNTGAVDADSARIYGTAMYAQDNPIYLINPAFNPIIDVPGWQPITDPAKMMGPVMMRPPGMMAPPTLPPPPL